MLWTFVIILFDLVKIIFLSLIYLTIFRIKTYKQLVNYFKEDSEKSGLIFYQKSKFKSAYRVNIIILMDILLFLPQVFIFVTFFRWKKL